MDYLSIKMITTIKSPFVSIKVVSCGPELILFGYKQINEKKCKCANRELESLTINHAIIPNVRCVIQVRAMFRTEFAVNSWSYPRITRVEIIALSPD